MVELTYDEQERFLLNIATGTEYYLLDTGSFTAVIFKQPDNKLKIRSNLIYDYNYKKALSEGLLPTKELEKVIVTRGLFTEDDESAIRSLESKLHAQQVILAKSTKVKANQDRLKNIINGIQEEINKIRIKKYAALSMSAEIKAEEQRNLFLCQACTYDDTGTTLFWKSYDLFTNDNNVTIKDSIYYKFINFYRGISTEVVRFIARSNIWRIRYITSQKVTEQLFGIATVDYTNDMINLAYWSNFYQNIYEMMPDERPSELIIEDDQSLDAFMKDYYEEKNRESMARKGVSKGSSAFDKEEVIVTQSNELYHDIQYDKPKEAQKIKDKNAFSKRTGRK